MNKTPSNHVFFFRGAAANHASDGDLPPGINISHRKGKGKSSTQNAILGGYVSSLEGSVSTFSIDRASSFSAMLLDFRRPLPCVIDVFGYPVTSGERIGPCVRGKLRI